MKFKPLSELLETPLRNGLTKPKKLRGSGFKMVNMGELFKYPRMTSIPMERAPLTEKEAETSLLRTGDLLFARQSLVREGAGKCSIFLYDNEPVFFESHLIRCRLCAKKCNPLFYYYFFDSLAGKQAIDAIIEQGAGAAGIRGSDLAKLNVPSPSIDFQNNVVSILDAIDKKIETNHQINQTLEQMAQALFKSWFVDFEPVKAKIAARQRWQALQPENEPASPVCYAAAFDEPSASSDLESCMNRAAMQAISGKTTDQLDALREEDPERYNELYETAALFPSAMQDSELGEMPEGWGCFSLDQIAKYQNGLALQKFRPENEDSYLPVVKISQLKKGYADGEEKAYPNINPECIIDDGDVVFSWSGSLIVDTWCGGRAALNQHLFKVTSSIYPKWLYFHFTRHHLEEFQRIASDKAVTMGHIKREHLKQALCAVPDTKYISIGKAIEGMFEKQINMRLESLTLSQIRDTLLPKLLSGEMNAVNRGEI